MIRTPLSALLLGAFAALPARATDGLRLEGSLSAGLSSEVEDAGIGRLDATLRLPLGRHAALPALELGLFSFYREASNPHETYVALNWGDTLRLGVVRPAYDAVLPSVFAGILPATEDALFESAGSFATDAALRHTSVPLGLSITQTTGELDWSLSLHDDARGDFRAVSAAVSHEARGWRIEGAVERVWHPQDASPEGTSAKLGLHRDMGAAEAGIALLHPGAEHGRDALELDFSYRAGARTTLSALAHVERSGGTDRYGLVTEHALGASDTLAVGATAGTGEAGLHAGLTHRF
ncbi:hypothetical protein [Salipiger mucosus]|uniref:Porin domain-containing protein n=1 Tax=Salipiger mucosus DSM 16094 TaxID=1123237 RepID=S9Q893_9RHOB|nr:hypothetical protein [Salipiger mucosus]EPX76232.1 hypothetical protein Salmuc_04533 [Salipiger mucosus DSM 16094]